MSDEAQLSPPQCRNFVRQRPSPRPRYNKERKHGDHLKALTVHLVETYARCSREFRYSLQAAPRRVLTKLSKGVHNGGYDNAEHDYICRVGDTIVNPDGQTYEILERLGHGSFGQVLKCQAASGSAPVALKIIKNKPAYFHQALIEVRILQMLNNEFSAEDDNRIVRMLDFFVFRKHLCISFELLSVNLYEVLKQNNFRGVSMALIRVLTEQLLKAMRCLRQAFVIHCDLKPENILLSNMQHTKIKLIDFGSACFESHTVYSYIQSRFYRSPEVLVGLPYTCAIDMWSLGCICAELFLGLPIFPGHSEYDQVCRLCEVLGLPPSHMLDLGKHTKRYFRREEAPDAETSRSGAAGQDGAMCAPANETSLLQGGGISEEARGEPDRGAAPAAARSPEAEQGDGGGAQSEENESLLDLLKRKLNIVGTDAEASQAPQDAPTDEQVEIHPPKVHVLDLSSSLGREQMKPVWEGSGAHGEQCQSSGSNRSTAADTGGSSRWRGTNSGTSGNDEAHGGAPPTEGSCELRAGGSSDGGTLRSGATSTMMDDAGSGGGEPCLRPHRPRSRKRCVQTRWRLKTREEFERDERKKEPVAKKYFSFASLDQMIELVPFKQSLTKRALKAEQERRRCFLQFLCGLFQVNPELRWTPHQASQHSFVTGLGHDPNFRPTEDDEAARPMPDIARSGLWGHLCAGVPLPDEHPAESYRPPIEKMSHDFLKNVVLTRQQQRGASSGSGGGEPQAKSRTSRPGGSGGAWSAGSAGASFCSSASSTGSTPTGGRGFRTSPYSVGSPLSACGGGGLGRGGPAAHGHAPQMNSGTTVTPVSSPHGSNASAANTRRTPHGPAGAVAQGRGTGSRDGSRGSSPWHLPSPMSELSTTSDRMNSSQPSGSDSNGEMAMHTWVDTHAHFDESVSEDPSHSDTPGNIWPRSTQLSDSDSLTPQSHDNTSHSARGSSGAEEERTTVAKDPQHALLANINRFPLRLENTLSPGSTGAMGNFREAVGMNESGPVIPFGHGARRAPLGFAGDEAAVAPSFTGGLLGFHPMQRGSPLGSGGEGGSLRHHSRRRNRRHNGTV